MPTPSIPPDPVPAHQPPNFNTNNYNKAYAMAFLGGGIDYMTGLPS